MDYSVKDSSVWRNDQDMSAVNINDAAVRVGIVRDRIKTLDGSIRYTVEVFKEGNSIMMSCQLMERYGGVFNFEEHTIRPYLANNGTPGAGTPIMFGDYVTRAGDVVVVTALGGDPREGIILGGIKHAARASELNPEEIAFRSRFNGVEEEIRADGTWKFTCKGLPVNEQALDVPPTGSTPIPEPQFNNASGLSFMGFDINGSFTVTDDNGNSIFIKKNKGNISIVSGNNRFEIGGTDLVGDNAVAMKADIAAIDAVDVSIRATNKINIQGASNISINSAKVAIGNDTVELLSTLVELIESLGKVQVVSPVGQCTPFMGTPQWVDVVKIKTKINTLTGNIEQAEILSTTVTDEDNFST